MKILKGLKLRSRGISNALFVVLAALIIIMTLAAVFR